MELINRYVAEVGKRLPLMKGRKDIENELRSTLEDMLEDRARKSGKTADDALAAELLKEYGSPQKIAQTYNPRPYLIGPRLYPMFAAVLKIVLGAVTLAMTVVAAIEIFQRQPGSAMDFAAVVGRWVGNVLSAGMGAFGNIALIFAAIERFVPIRDVEVEVVEGEEWNPAALLKEPDPEDAPVWSSILSIVLTFVVLVIFNFNSRLIGVYFLEDYGWRSIPLLSEAFFRWLPAMNALWIADILLNAALLRAGRWQVSTRAFFIVLKLFQIGVLAALLSGPSILALSPAALQGGGLADPEAARILSLMAQQGVRVALALGILGSLVEAVKMGARIVKKA